MSDEGSAEVKTAFFHKRISISIFFNPIALSCTCKEYVQAYNSGCDLPFRHNHLGKEYTRLENRLLK